MRFELHKNGIDVDSSLEKAVDVKVAKLSERLKRYHPEVAELEMRLEAISSDNSYQAALKLMAFKDTLHAKKSAPVLREAVDRVFEAMFKELDAYRSRINKNLNYA